MSESHTLTRHRDIQNWVTDRKGLPAIARQPDDFGQMRARLCLSFERRRRDAASRAKADDGMSPCSWTAWLAELDRQNLALRVTPGSDADFEFVDRAELH
jgi:hypothetical protein